MQAALQRYEAACGGAPERLVSGSDDFTMFLWEPSVSKKPLQRLTGHMQLINQVHPCCSRLPPQEAPVMIAEETFFFSFLFFTLLTPGVVKPKLLQLRYTNNSMP